MQIQLKKIGTAAFDQLMIICIFLIVLKDICNQQLYVMFADWPGALNNLFFSENSERKNLPAKVNEVQGKKNNQRKICNTLNRKKNYIQNEDENV